MVQGARPGSPRHEVELRPRLKKPLTRELNVTQPREEGRQLRRHYQGVRLKPDTAVDDNADPV